MLALRSISKTLELYVIQRHKRYSVTCTCQQKSCLGIQGRIPHFISFKMCLDILIAIPNCYALDICWIAWAWATIFSHKCRISTRSHDGPCGLKFNTNVFCVTIVTSRSRTKRLLTVVCIWRTEGNICRFVAKNESQGTVSVQIDKLETHLASIVVN